MRVIFDLAILGVIVFLVSLGLSEVDREGDKPTLIGKLVLIGGLIYYLFSQLI